MPIQALDIILLAVMILSGLLAMERGLIWGILSLVAWGAAALVTLVVYTHFRADVRAFITPPMLADAILLLIVFIGSLIGFTVLMEGNLNELVFKEKSHHEEEKKTKKDAVEPPIVKLDRMLAFPFGLLRGLVIVVIAYLVTGEMVARQNMPRWVTEARSLYLIEYTGDAIKSLMPDNPEWLFRKRGRE